MSATMAKCADGLRVMVGTRWGWDSRPGATLPDWGAFAPDGPHRRDGRKLPTDRAAPESGGGHLGEGSRGQAERARTDDQPGVVSTWLAACPANLALTYPD